jgi:hypothetical protein
MVDNTTYKQLHQDSTEVEPEVDDLGQEAMDREDPPDGPFILLLPASTRGYGMHDKKWSKLAFHDARVFNIS